MPGGDGTGPRGQGPGSGRGLGSCNQARWPGRGGWAAEAWGGGGGRSPSRRAQDLTRALYPERDSDLRERLMSLESRLAQLERVASAQPAD